MRSGPMVARTCDGYAARRHLKKTDVNPIDPRWYLVLSLHMTNTPVSEISEITGYATPTIYSILQRDEVIEIRQQILHHTGQEFENLYAKVVEAISAGLEHADPTVQLNAAEKWLKAHGKYKGTESGAINVTAENVVMQILQQAQVGET